MRDNNDIKNGGLSRWIKIPAYFLLGVILLLVVVRLSLKSTWVHNWVKDYVVEIANEQLTADLQIDKLSGDLWGEVTLSGIHLVADDTVATADTVSVSYNITSYFGDAFNINEITIRKPNVNVIEEGDTWNIANLTVPPEEPAADSEPFRFRIQNIEIEDGFIFFYAPSVLADSSLQVTNTSLDGSISYYGDLYDARLKSLTFQLENTRLENSVTIETSASADEKSITLDKLVLATGQSFLTTSGNMDRADSVTALTMQGEPVAWQDIAAYTENIPLEQNLEVDLGIKGSLKEFEVEVGMRGEGLDSLRFAGGVKMDSTFSIHFLRMNVARIDPAILIGDTTMPVITNLHAEFAGDITPADYRQSNGKLTFSIDDIKQDDYNLSAVNGLFDLQSGSLNGNLEARNGAQQLSTVLQATGIWAEEPSVVFNLNGRNINPAYWSQNKELSGAVNFAATASGKGWYPKERQWDYSLNMQNSRLMEQEIGAVQLDGRFNLESVTANGFIRLIESRLNVDVSAENLTDVPEYDYKLNFTDYDISDLAGNNEYSSSLAGQLSGKGRGVTPETIQMNSSIRIDSSIINGEMINYFSGDFEIRDTLLIVEDAQLESTIADATFDARYHLLRSYDQDNQLAFNLELKDVQSLSPLAGADTLQAEGIIEGTLNPAPENTLKFTGSINLQNLVYNNIKSTGAQGDGEVLFKENPEYDLDLNLAKPELPAVVLQDLRLTSNGSLSDEGPRGSFMLQFSSTQEGEIVHSGSYEVSSDTVNVQTTQLDISSQLRTLSLQQPFSVVLAGNSIRTDTLRLTSEDGATLELAVPYADSARQTGYLRGESLNTTAIQNILLEEAFFEGYLSGEFQFAREDTVLEATGDLLLSEFNYQDTRFDSLSVATEINNERLSGTMVVTESGQRIIDAKADIPFKLGDPEQFSETFFDEPVLGELEVKPIALDRFQKLLEDYGIENTEGILSFNGHLEGKAGNPEFSANVKLEKAILSGVSVDSLTANMNYLHKLSVLKVDASVVSLQQKAAEVNTEIPLYIDLESFEVRLPEEDDPITANINTNGFNLAALNDFLDNEQVSNIEGELNGNVQIKGTVGDLKTDGKMALKGGSVRLVPAEITIERIRSELLFEPDQLTLANFTARSGRGRLNAEGRMELEKLVPGDMDIRITASNFRAVNSSEFNAVINMDVRSRGTLTQPKMTGDLIFVNGFAELDNFGEKSVENVELDSPAEDQTSISLYDSLALEMNVTFNRRFFIRNQRFLEMEIELEGELDLVKESGKDLELFGTMNTAGGYARPLGKRFELQEGSVTFAGEPANPELAVRTRYTPPQTQEEVIIWYIIEGTVENPQFTYASEPEMELENIISYTLFGQPFYALDSWKQVVANSGSNTSATDMALDVLLDRVEALATQRLGIDVVKIDNTRQGTENGTSITTGWYLSSRAFFAIQNIISGSTPDTGFLLEYLLMKNLKLIIRQENSSHQGVNLQWNFDY